MRRQSTVYSATLVAYASTRAVYTNGKRNGCLSKTGLVEHLIGHFQDVMGFLHDFLISFQCDISQHMLEINLL